MCRRPSGRILPRSFWQSMQRQSRIKVVLQGNGKGNGPGREMPRATTIRHGRRGGFFRIMPRGRGGGVVAEPLPLLLHEGIEVAAPVQAQLPGQFQQAPARQVGVDPDRRDGGDGAFVPVVLPHVALESVADDLEVAAGVPVQAEGLGDLAVGSSGPFGSGGLAFLADPEDRSGWCTWTCCCLLWLKCNPAATPAVACRISAGQEVI